MSEAPAGWLRAIDEALVAAHIGIASESDDYDTAKRKLGELIDWHIGVATDPAVNGGRQLVPVEPTPPVQPFGYLRQTNSDRNPPHGWALHFFGRPGDVEVYLRPPTSRMPEPMTPNDINIAAGAELAGLLDHIYEHSTASEGVMPLAMTFARAIEAEVLRRVKEANK